MRKQVRDDIIAVGQAVLDSRQARIEEQAAEIERLTVALHHIACQLPVSDVVLDWHEEWRNLRHEAVLALKGTTEMTRKPKRVEFCFDERSVVTAEEVNAGEYGLVGFGEEQMKILQSYRLNEVRLKAEIKQFRQALAKSDPIHRVYDGTLPVLECIHCGGRRGRLENEVQHAGNCIWKRAHPQEQEAT